MTSQLLTVPELAEQWRCGEQSILRLIRAKQLKATKVVGRWLIDPSDAEVYRKSQANVSAPASRPRARRRRSA